MCLLSHISPMERLFVLKTLSRTQRTTKVKKFVGFSLKLLRCRDPALPPLYGHAYSRPFFSCTRMRISRVYTRMIHRRGFSTLVLFIYNALVYIPHQRTIEDACVCNIHVLTHKTWYSINIRKIHIQSFVLTVEISMFMSSMICIILGTIIDS